MKTGGDLKSGLYSVLKHPITVGTLGGATLGGGIGYLTASDDELRRRNALAGAGAGALLGGLGGVVASSGKGPDEVTSVANRAHDLGRAVGAREGFSKGLEKGTVAGTAKLTDEIFDAIGPDEASVLFDRVHGVSKGT